LFSQTYVVKGKIRNDIGQPIEFGLIGFGENFIKLTDTLGAFKFDSVPAGSYTLNHSIAFYEPLSYTFQVPCEDLDINLGKTFLTKEDEKYLEENTGSKGIEKFFKEMPIGDHYDYKLSIYRTSGEIRLPNGKPAISATISVVGTAFEAQTDSLGHFTIDFPQGKYDLNVNLNGYYEKHVQLLIPFKGKLLIDLNKSNGKK
jgi:hypothetical protein